jgi:hypothetical protein
MSSATLLSALSQLFSQSLNAFIIHHSLHRIIASHHRIACMFLFSSLRAGFAAGYLLPSPRQPGERSLVAHHQFHSDSVCDDCEESNDSENGAPIHAVKAMHNRTTYTREYSFQVSVKAVVEVLTVNVSRH